MFVFRWPGNERRVTPTSNLGPLTTRGGQLMSRKASKLICKVSKSIIIIIFKSVFFLQSSIIALTKTGIALAETGDVSSSQGSQEMEVEAPTSRGDGGGGNVAKDKVQGGDTVKGGIKGKRGKRKRKGWDKHKKGEKGRGKEDIARKAKVDDKIEKIMRAKENLENPYDEMDIDTKKSHALFFYNDEMSQMLSNSEVAFSTRSIAVKERVAKKVGVSVRTMKRWVLEYWSEEEVKKSRRGKHSKCESPIDDVEFRASFCQYVRSHAKPKGVFLF